MEKANWKSISGNIFQVFGLNIGIGGKHWNLLQSMNGKIASKGSVRIDGKYGSTGNQSLQSLLAAIAQ